VHSGMNLLSALRGWALPIFASIARSASSERGHDCFMCGSFWSGSFMTFMTIFRISLC
jgi:hypothetical protein